MSLLHYASANVEPRVQVACERYDAKALLKKWDNGYVTMGSSLLASGSTVDKTISRALGGGGSDAANKVAPMLRLCCSCP